MSTGFRLNGWLCIGIAGFIQFWPSPAMQAAVHTQMHLAMLPDGAELNSPLTD